MIRALDGGPLVGDKFVRFVYLDETGTGDIKREPYVIVSGVMVEADSQWKLVEHELIEMADAFAVPEDRDGFCFHANELYTGGKAEFRAKYPLEKRHVFLEGLCEIPKRFNLPVFMFAVERDDYGKKAAARLGSPNADKVLTELLMHASIACAHGVNEFLHFHAPANEVASLVYEQNGKKSRYITDYHKIFRSDKILDVIEQLENPCLKRLDRIIDAPFHQQKMDSSLLQIADACAYIFGRKMRGADLPNRFYTPILHQVVFANKAIMKEAIDERSDSARGDSR